MKTKLATLLVVGISSLSLLFAARAADGDAGAAAPANGSGDESAEIAVPAGPLNEAIDALAQMAGITVMVKEGLFEGVGPDGKPLAMPRFAGKVFKGASPEQALLAVLKLYDLELVKDIETSTSFVRKKSNVEPRLTEIVPVRFGAQYSTNSMAITNLSTMLQQSFANSRIIADTRTSKLIINATRSEWLEISNILKQLDVPVKQILIEARFVQTTTRPESIKGIDWTPTLEGQTVTFGNGLTQFQSTTTTPGSTGGGTSPSGRPLSGGGGSSTSSQQDTLVSPTPGIPGLSINTLSGFSPSTAFLSAEGVKVVLSFLNKDTDSEFIANPQAVALEGQPTELSDVQNIPVFEEQQGQITGNTTQPNTVKPNYELKVGNSILNEVGVKLLVTPRITGETNVFMDLKPELSAKGPDRSRCWAGAGMRRPPLCDAK